MIVVERQSQFVQILQTIFFAIDAINLLKKSSGTTGNEATDDPHTQRQREIRKKEKKKADSTLTEKRVSDALSYGCNNFGTFSET